MTMGPALGPSDSCGLLSLQSMAGQGPRPQASISRTYNGFTLLQSGVGSRRKLHQALHDLQSMLLLFFFKKQVKRIPEHSPGGDVLQGSLLHVSGCMWGLLFRASGGPGFLVYQVNQNWERQVLSLVRVDSSMEILKSVISLFHGHFQELWDVKMK